MKIEKCHMVMVSRYVPSSEAGHALRWINANADAHVVLAAAVAAYRETCPKAAVGLSNNDIAEVFWIRAGTMSVSAVLDGKRDRGQPKFAFSRSELDANAVFLWLSV
jgi:hypothetical protein